MAIILRLDRVMADRKISLNELAERVGITNVNLSNLKTGKVKAIRFSTLNAICRELTLPARGYIGISRRFKRIECWFFEGENWENLILRYFNK